jgi:hypothetical protein
VLKTIIKWAVIVFIIYFIVKNPHGAGGIVQNGLSALKSAGSSLAKFVSNL